jgi:hypothetical protein
LKPYQAAQDISSITHREVMNLMRSHATIMFGHVYLKQKLESRVPTFVTSKKFACSHILFSSMPRKPHTPAEKIAALLAENKALKAAQRGKPKHIQC